VLVSQSLWSKAPKHKYNTTLTPKKKIPTNITKYCKKTRKKIKILQKKKIIFGCEITYKVIEIKKKFIHFRVFISSAVNHDIFVHFCCQNCCFHCCFRCYCHCCQYAILGKAQYYMALFRGPHQDNCRR